MAFNKVIYHTSGESLLRSWKLTNPDGSIINITNYIGNVKIINLDNSLVISGDANNGYLTKNSVTGTFNLNFPGNLLTIAKGQYVLQFNILDGSNTTKAIEDSLLVVNWG